MTNGADENEINWKTYYRLKYCAADCLSNLIIIIVYISFVYMYNIINCIPLKQKTQ